MKKLLLAGILLLISLFLFSAEVIRYINTDSTSGGDGTTNATSGANRAYPTLNNWESNEQTNLVTDGDWHHVYVSAPSGTADTTTTGINGWTTDATHYIHIQAADGDQAVKTGWDTSRYRLSKTDGKGIQVIDDHVIIDGLQIETIYTDTTGSAIYWSYAGTGTIKNCRLRASGADTNTNTFTTETSGLTLTFYNTIFETLDGSNNVYFRGGTHLYMYNCIVYNNGSGNGIYIRDSSSTITNVASFNTGNDFYHVGTGSDTISFCASDDGDGSDPVAASGSNWDNEYTDPSNGDFTLLNTGNTYHGGADNPSSGLYTTDMEGDAYNSGAYSIGVDEYVAVGGNAPTADLQGPLIGPLGGPIMAFMLMYSTMTTILIGYIFHRLQQYKKRLLFYTKENIQAIAEIDRFLDGGT